MSGSVVVQTKALWTWSAPVAGQAPVVLAYPTTKGPTKSGMMPADLKAYLQVPIVQRGTPPIPVPDEVIVQWIRWAEDDIESDTNIRLCQTWIAAPAAKAKVEVEALSIGVQNGYQQLGIDYDYSEAGYDFLFERWKDEGWGYQRMRWRPVQGVEVFDPSGIVDALNFTGTKNVAMIYPLLNEYFRVPATWVVEDQKRGMLRFVPAVSVQMLPLFALQLSFMGFAQSVPGALWFQYTAGLTANDYNSDWSFMRQLVLAKAGVTALQAMQTSVNNGAIETSTQVDGLQRRVRYPENGAYIGTIKRFEADVTRLSKRARMMGGGLALGIL